MLNFDDHVVLACGGRNYDDWQTVYRVLDEIHRERAITKLVHGAARGADQLAGAWANRNGVFVARRPADWNRHGRAAGVMRNQAMLDEFRGRLALVVAFPGGRGTKDMVTRARYAGIRVRDLAEDLT